MFPYIDLHFIKIPMYGLCIVLGIFTGSFFVYRGCKKNNKIFLNFIIISALVSFFSFVGAKLLFLLVTYPIKLFPKILFLILFASKKIPEGLGAGFIFYGGMAGGFCGYLLGCKIAKCKITEFFPELSFLIPLVHSFGRTGCFCAGCCYGIPYNGPFALHYHEPITNVAPEIGIFPVQPLEALLMLIFAVIMLVRYFNNKKVSVLLYLLYYSVLRFCMEFLRGDFERRLFGPFSTSQWISIGLFCISLGLFIFQIIYKKNIQTNSDNRQIPH